MGQGSQVMHQSHRSSQWSRVTGHLTQRSRVRDQGHRSGVKVTGQGLQLWGQEALVKGHGSSQGSRVSVTGQRSKVTGQGSLVRVKGHWSKVTGQGSLVKPFSIIRPYTNPIQLKVWK